jgi:TIR domain
VDVFISYAHIDNTPMTEGQLGWVTRFHKSLEAMLSMRLGRKVEIWRDQKLGGNDDFSAEIVDQFSHASLLLSVLTPRYVESDWCTREARTFCELAEKAQGVRVENQYRLIKVIKTPVSSEEPLPSVMKNLLGYRFYTLADDEIPMELDPAYGEELAQEYCRQVGKLAWEVAKTLKLLEAQTAAGQAAPAATSAAAATTRGAQAAPAHTAFLADCSFDRREAREVLEGELRLHGVRVLPDLQLPKTEAEHVAAVERLLAECDLSIHLVGTTFGAVPDGPSQKSEVVLQNELAIARCKAGGLARIIWLPEGTASAQAQQQALIEALQRDAEAQLGADLITGDLEALRGAVHTALKKLDDQAAAAAPAPPDGEAAPGLVYLICDDRDRKDTIPLRKFLKHRGLDVRIPIFEGDAATRRQQHEEMLAQCDALVVFYGAGDEAWKAAVENDLRKLRGYRAKLPAPVGFTYLAAPATTGKEELIELEEPNLIDGLGGFDEAAAGALTAALEARR